MTPSGQYNSALRMLLLILLVAAPALAQIVPQPKMGAPLNGLSAVQLSQFNAGAVDFDHVFTVAEGLGPIFNQNSCGSCHNNPTGGSGTITVVRFGLLDAKSGTFDPLSNLGGSLQQSQSITVACAETVPAIANVTANRVTNSTLGSGLVEAIDDADISANVGTSGVSGKVHMVPVLEDPNGPLRVGRFGWKAQLATVLSFSGDATLMECGITNRLVGQENAPNGDTVLLAACDGVSDPEDGPDSNGLDFIDRVTHFQRYLAPPPQTPRSGMSGEALFTSIGCAACHTPQYTTVTDPGLEPFLSGQVIRPYSDFLLHDMGQAADFIEQGGAGQRELRTPSLWGVRVRDPLWHDGRVAGGTFADRIKGANGAIMEHDALLSEAQPSAQAFFALSSADQDRVVAFLDSLGRAEFDADGDNDIDYLDLQGFLAAQAASVTTTFTPDDAEAVFDIDQDGDVDSVDFSHFINVYEDDCNQNGVNDLKDILVNLTSFDANGNLIPDECETCQQNLGFGGPGSLTFAICGDDLTMPGGVASAVISGAMPGNQVFVVISNIAVPRPFGAGTIVPGAPFTVFPWFFADSNGQVVETVTAGGPPAMLTLQAATINPSSFVVEFSNAVKMSVGF